MTTPLDILRLLQSRQPCCSCCSSDEAYAAVVREVGTLLAVPVCSWFTCTKDADAVPGAVRHSCAAHRSVILGVGAVLRLGE